MPERPTWFEDSLLPHEPHWLELDGHVLHYLRVGSASGVGD